MKYQIGDRVNHQFCQLCDLLLSSNWNSFGMVCGKCSYGLVDQQLKLSVPQKLKLTDLLYRYRYPYEYGTNGVDPVNDADYVPVPCEWCDSFGYEHISYDDYHHARTCDPGCSDVGHGVFIEHVSHITVRTACFVCAGKRYVWKKSSPLEQLAKAGELSA